MLSKDLKVRLNIAKLAATTAGNLHRRYNQQKVLVETKSSGIDLVTAVDRQCDEAIREILGSLCPEDILLTEETFPEGGSINLERTWIVDPLDGTTNFAHGFPYFAVSIAYAIQGIPQVAVVYDAIKNEMFTAIRGEGAFLNGQPIRVSETPRLDCALLATGFPYDTHIRPQDNMEYFLKFMTRCHGVRRAGAAALDLAYLACGRLDGFWELRLAPWDVAAGSLLIEEAGGQVSDFFGKPLNYSQRRINIVGANHASLHQEIVDICKTSPVASLAG